MLLGSLAIPNWQENKIHDIPNKENLSGVMSNPWLDPSFKPDTEMVERKEATLFWRLQWWDNFTVLLADSINELKNEW